MCQIFQQYFSALFCVLCVGIKPQKTLINEVRDITFTRLVSSRMSLRISRLAGDEKSL